MVVVPFWHEEVYDLDCFQTFHVNNMLGIFIPVIHTFCFSNALFFTSLEKISAHACIFLFVIFMAIIFARNFLNMKTF